MSAFDPNPPPGSSAYAITASQIANTPAGNITATNTQDALNELDTEKAGLAALAAAGGAALIGNTPAGNIASVTEQGAINELDAEKAALAGSASQVFSVGTPTSADHAVQLQQISLYPTVASAATVDIFGAAGSTVNISGTTIVIAITACTAAQVGSIKTIIPSNASGFSITASASIVVDGAISGTYLMPQNAIVQIIATSTTTFKITTIYASGSWTPNQGAGLTVVGAFSSIGNFVKIGRKVTLIFSVTGATTIACSAGGIISSNAPFAGVVSNYPTGNALRGVDNSVYGIFQSANTTNIMLGSIAITATSGGIYLTITYFV